MDHGNNMNDHGMNMAMTPPPSSPSSPLPSSSPSPHHRMMMHMSFYWGTDAIILFPGWPGTHISMYILALVLVFLLAFMVEGLSRSRHINDKRRNLVVSGLLLTLLHTIRMGLAYLLMLALMSFNGGVFIVGVLGHAVGFLVFGTRVFGSDKNGAEDPDNPRSDLHKNSDRLPPMSC